MIFTENSLPTHLIDRQKKRLERFDLGLRPLTSRELRKIGGLTENASNYLSLAATSEGRVVVVKQYREDLEKGASSSERAYTEFDIIQHISRQQQRGIVIPRLLGKPTFDHQNTPTIVTEYIDGYSPLIALQPTLESELRNSGLATITPLVIRGLSLLHSRGVVHRDLLFGENIGLVIQNKRTIRCGFIDFELSEKTDEITSRMSDLRDLAAFLIQQLGNQKYEKNLQRLSTFFGNYNLKLVGLRPTDESSFGQQIVAEGLKRIEQNNMLLIYG